jgi:hypothetical protein
MGGTSPPLGRGGGQNVSVSAENRVRDFMNYLARMIEDLSPRPYY